MPAPDSMNCEKLSKLIGTPRAPILLDVRKDSLSVEAPRLLPGARPVSEASLTPEGLRQLAQRLKQEHPGQPVLALCQEGHGRSQSVAAWLRSDGMAAEYLEDGYAAWVAAGLPSFDASKLHYNDKEGRSLWVTRARPKIDRIACPWLIRRFVDPRAVFLFVAPSEVENVATSLGAAPFDIDGVFWSHRGETCTFDTMIAEFGLHIPALDRLALIVRGADTARLDLAPECAGLLAASLGLSRIHSDDHTQLEAGIGLYDAFYRWARDATEETHDWQSHKKTKK